MKKVLFFSFLFILGYSCKNEEKQKEIQWSKENSVELNKNLTIEEDLDIEVFLAKKENWKVTKTGTGLRYYIYKKENGIQAKPGMTAEVSFKINLLNGELIYETKEDEIYSFKIDKSDVETGIQEGVKFMKKGEKAKLIIPSHLAHGLTGDQNKIPPLTTLVVDIHLTNLK